MKCICFCTHLRENAKNAKKNQNAKKPKRKRTQKTKTQKKPKRIFSRTKTHIFKNEDARKRKPRRKFLENDVNLAVASTVVLLDFKPKLMFRVIF